MQHETETAHREGKKGKDTLVNDILLHSEDAIYVNKWEKLVKYVKTAKINLNYPHARN